MFRVIIVLIFLTIFKSYSQENTEIAEKFFSEFLIKNNISQENYETFFSERFKEKCSYATLVTSINSINKSFGKSEKIIKVCYDNDTNTVNLVDKLIDNQKLRGWKIILDSIHKVSGFFVVRDLKCMSNDFVVDTSRYGYSYKKRYKGDEFTIKYNLSIPSNADKFNLILLLQGSGVHQADYRVGDNKIFKQMSEYLLSNQIASISIDKRSVNNPEMVKTLYDEQISDAKSILLKEIHENKNKIEKVYILGHSLGAISALSIAKEFEEVDGLILFGGTLRNIFLVMEDQVNSINKNNPKSPAVLDLKEKISYGIDSLSINSPSSKLPFNIPASYWISVINHSNIDLELLKDKNINVLYGAKDPQLYSDDIDIWQKNIKKGIKINKIPFTNHFMGFNFFKPKHENSLKNTQVRKRVMKEIISIIEDDK